MGDPLSASGHVSVVNSGTRARIDSIGGRAGSLRRYGQSSREGNTMDEKDNIEIVEEFDVEVTEQGDVVMEDTVAAIDLDTGEAVIDDIVAVEAADGSGFVEETISEVDADGNQTVLADVWRSSTRSRLPLVPACRPAWTVLDEIGVICGLTVQEGRTGGVSQPPTRRSGGEIRRVPPQA